MFGLDFMQKQLAEQRRKDGTWGNFAGGEELMKLLKARLGGLDPRQRAMIEGQAGGQIAGGTQAINENFAGSGGSIGPKLGALTALRSNVGKNTQNTLLEGDLNAQNSGIQGLFQGGSMNADIGQKNRALNMQQQQIDDQPGFLENLLSGLAGGAGACCFIFMEAYNGNMPYWVRECRDEFAPESTKRREGYIKMAKWLVPLMQKSKVIRYLVNLLMIKPLTKWGGYYKKVKGYENAFIYKPFVKFWFKLWQII